MVVSSGVQDERNIGIRINKGVKKEVEKWNTKVEDGYKGGIMVTGPQNLLISLKGRPSSGAPFLQLTL